jgi:hypothetical protein
VAQLVLKNQGFVMLGWLDSREVDEFSEWLTKELCKRYPPSGLDTDPKKATSRLMKVHNSLLMQVEAFARDHGLNIYTKARLGNRIKWNLREAGYPVRFADTFAHEVVTVISVIKAKQGKDVPKR